jgi:CspA family cold shock protein
MLAPYLQAVFNKQSDFGLPAGPVVAKRSFRTPPDLACGIERDVHTRCVTAALCFIWHMADRGDRRCKKGTVKWFNSTKGYGFIMPSNGDKDVFVHISAVERAGLRTLNEGQPIEYELVTNRGRASAENLKV